MRALLPLVLFATPCLVAQQASPYVPLQHWAMPYVEQLIATGVVADPTPLTRPLRQADLVQALQSADTASASGAVRATVRRLLAEFRPRARAPLYRVDADAGLAAATYPFRDPLEQGRGVPRRPYGPSRAFGSVGAQLQLQFGPGIAVTHIYEDSRLRYDTDWFDTRRNGIRSAEAYLDGQWRYGEVFFGILDRNWGPSGIQGLLLSDNPYDFDHFAIKVGVRAIQLQAVVTQLDTRTDVSGNPINAFMLQHRLYVRPRGPWTFALWEGSVWTGVGRQAEPWYLNVLNVGYLVGSYGNGNVNSFAGFDVERRGSVTLFGQFMADDIQYQKGPPTDTLSYKPASDGFTLGAKGRLRGAAAAWTVFYTQVANLTYRNEDDLQVPLFHGLPTGRNFADYDQLTAKLSILARPGGELLLLEPEATVLRQGEGDPRLPHPVVSQYLTTPTLFQGVMERTFRIALGGSWQRRGFGLSGSGGVHFVRNAGHVRGATATHWVGTLGVTYRIRYEHAVE